jgi:hypothetical protein
MIATVIVHHTAQFWPDVTRVSAALAAVGSFLAALGTFLNRRRIADVHVLLNGQLHGKIQQLSEVADELRAVTLERDALQATRQPGGKRATDPPVG